MSVDNMTSRVISHFVSNTSQTNQNILKK